MAATQEVDDIRTPQPLHRPSSAFAPDNLIQSIGSEDRFNSLSPMSNIEQDDIDTQLLKKLVISNMETMEDSEMLG